MSTRPRGYGNISDTFVSDVSTPDKLGSTAWSISRPMNDHLNRLEISLTTSSGVLCAASSHNSSPMTSNSLRRSNSSSNVALASSSSVSRSAVLAPRASKRSRRISSGTSINTVRSAGSKDVESVSRSSVLEAKLEGKEAGNSTSRVFKMKSVRIHVQSGSASSKPSPLEGN